MTQSILVIGYGNALRSDDGVGVRAAEAIARRFPAITALAVPQLTPELSAHLAAASIVIFMDAGAKAEAVSMDAIQPTTAPLAPHFSDPSSLLALTEMLHGRRPSAWHVAIPAQDFAVGEHLTEQGERFLRLAVDTIAQFIRRASGAG